MGKRRVKNELTLEGIRAIYDDNVRRAEETARQAPTAERSADSNRNIAMHGTREVKQKRWAEYQSFIETLHRKNHDLSYNKLTEFAGSHFGVCKKTIWRNTENPLKRRKSV